MGVPQLWWKSVPTYLWSQGSPSQTKTDQLIVKSGIRLHSNWGQLFHTEVQISPSHPLVASYSHYLECPLGQAGMPPTPTSSRRHTTYAQDKAPLPPPEHENMETVHLLCFWWLFNLQNSSPSQTSGFVCMVCMSSTRCTGVDNCTAKKMYYTQARYRYIHTSQMLLLCMYCCVMCTPKCMWASNKQIYRSRMWNKKIIILTHSRCDRFSKNVPQPHLKHVVMLVCVAGQLSLLSCYFDGELTWNSQRSAENHTQTVMYIYGCVVQKGDPDQRAISQTITPYEPGPDQGLVDLNLEYLEYNRIKYNCYRKVI